MNEVLKTIANRRSVRQFKSAQIKDEELAAILEAGLQAPSGHNDQPWYFTVIQNKDLLEEINRESKKEMQKMSIDWIVSAGKNEKLNIFYSAPTVVLVSAKEDAVTPEADVSAAIENMFLAAESMNIGSCWIGLVKCYFNNPENLKNVSIPDGYKPFYGISLGYKSEGVSATPPKRKNESYYNIIK